MNVCAVRMESESAMHLHYFLQAGKIWWYRSVIEMAHALCVFRLSFVLCMSRATRGSCRFSCAAGSCCVMWTGSRGCKHNGIPVCKECRWGIHRLALIHTCLARATIVRLIIRRTVVVIVVTRKVSFHVGTGGDFNVDCTRNTSLLDCYSESPRGA